VREARLINDPFGRCIRSEEAARIGDGKQSTVERSSIGSFNLRSNYSSAVLHEIFQYPHIFNIFLHVRTFISLEDLRNILEPPVIHQV
jgi:hypothetical protein